MNPPNVVNDRLTDGGVEMLEARKLTDRQLAVIEEVDGDLEQAVASAHEKLQHAGVDDDGTEAPSCRICTCPGYEKPPAPGPNPRCRRDRCGHTLFSHKFV